jgi:hypothetical protein
MVVSFSSCRHPGGCHGHQILSTGLTSSKSKMASFVPRERNFLVLEPGSFALKINVASYIDLPLNVVLLLPFDESPTSREQNAHPHLNRPSVAR